MSSEFDDNQNMHHFRKKKHKQNRKYINNDYDIIVKIVNHYFNFTIIDHTLFNSKYINSIFRKFQSLQYENMFIDDIFNIINNTFIEPNVSRKDYFSHAMTIYNIINNSLTSIVSEVSDEKFECPLCYEEKDDNVMTKCGHKFCKCCINSYMKNKLNFVCPLCRDINTKTLIVVNCNGFIKPISIDLIHIIIHETYNFLNDNKWKFSEICKKRTKENKKKISSICGNSQFKENEIIFVISLIAKKYGCHTDHIYIKNKERIYNNIQKRKERHETYDIPNWCFND